MLSVLTINHNNTEISFLENFAFNKDNLHLALGGLIDKRGIDECFILSTCNRIEINTSHCIHQRDINNPLQKDM